MPALAITGTYPLYTDDLGRPLEGKVYFGLPNQNPITAPKQVYWDKELTQPAAQPLSVSGGYIVRAGTPARLFSDGDYSSLVQTKNNETVFYVKNNQDADSGGSLGADLANALDDTKGDALVAVKQPFAGSVARTQHQKNTDFISVMDFGAKGDGVTDDTVAINNALAAIYNIKKSLFFPAGTYKYNGGGVLGVGNVVCGEGRHATKIIVSNASPNFVFKADGVGAGVRDMSFSASIAQTGGCWVFLNAPETFIDNFYMTGDYNGVLMRGNVSRILNGRFQDGAAGAIRIKAEGGDNSQLIDNVLMGAQSPPNISEAGIRIRNSSALIITNTSIIQQGVAVKIDPYSNTTNTIDSGSVYSLYVDNCFFDNCTKALQISPTNDAVVVRSRFSNCWFGSSSNDGVSLSGVAVDSVSGIHFESCHSVLNAGSGVTIGSGCKDITFNSGILAANNYGFFVGGSPIFGLKISNATIGNAAGLAGNAAAGIVLGASAEYITIKDNYIIGNGNSIIDNATTTNKYIASNHGYITQSSGLSIITTGNSSVTINHNLSKIPLPQDIEITQNANFGTNTLFVDTTSVTTTSFVVRSVSAAVANLFFSWRARSSGA